MFEWTTSTILFASAVGAFVGFVSGIFGVGGGFLLVPILNAVLGVPMPIAVGSAACYSLGPATTAMLARKPGAGYFEMTMILGGGLLAGVMSGSWAVGYFGDASAIHLAGASIPAAEFWVLSCYLVLMLVIAGGSLWDVLRSGKGTIQRRGLLAFAPVPPIARIPDLRPSVYSIPLLALTGLIVGFLSGFLGMSGGLILVPASIYLLGMRAQDATTLTVVMVWVVALQSTFMHAYHVHVHLRLTLSLLICGTIGAAIGSQAGLRLTGRKLKTLFGSLVLLAAAIVAIRLVWLIMGARQH